MMVRIANQTFLTLQDMAIPQQVSRQLRRADDFISLAVCASFETLKTSGIDVADEHESLGIVLASAFGPMQTNFDVLDQVVTEEPVSPTLFSHSVFNGAAGYVATTLKITGGAQTITEFSFPFLRAIEQGVLAIKMGSVDKCLVAHVETYSELIQDVKTKLTSNEPWQPGVVCWLLEQCSDSNEENVIKSISIDSRGGDSVSYLDFQDEISLNGELIKGSEPLDIGKVLTKYVTNRKSATQTEIEVKNDFGSACMVL